MVLSRQARRWRRSALALASMVVVAGTVAVSPAAAEAIAAIFRGDLRDLQPATPEPFEGARAQVLIAGHGGPHHSGSTVLLTVKGIGAGAAGQTFGAHLHVGPCVAGSGAAALGHYNHSANGEVSPTTEVWLDITPTRSGYATAVAHVPFVPTPGQRSVVIHALPTAPNGTAGLRLACLPVEW